MRRSAGSCASSCRRPRTSRPPSSAAEETALAAAVKSANRRLADHQRIAGRAPFPEPDFPRTHTRKVRRSAVADRMAGVPLSR